MTPLSHFHRLRACVAFALVATCTASCGQEDPRGPLRHITGRLEVPAGVDLENCTVLASREDRLLLEGSANRTGDSFDISVRGDEPVDLQAYRRGPMIHLSNAPGEFDAIVAKLQRERASVGRLIHSVGELEGYVRGVMPGATGVVIRLSPRQLQPLRMRALSVDGTPLADAEVWLASMADWIEVKTGTDGRVDIEGVPVRPWELEVHAPQAAWPHAVRGRATVTPGSPELDVPLRPSVVVRVNLKTVPTGRILLRFGNARTDTSWTIGWRPGPSGAMDIAADPDWPEVRVSLERITEQTEQSWDSVTLARGTVALAPGARLELDPSE